MRRRYRRVGLTAAQSAELWERWKKGEGLKSIGRVFVHLRPHQAERRHKTAAKTALAASADPFRARRNLQRSGRRPLAPHDRRNVGALALDDQPRDQP